MLTHQGGSRSLGLKEKCGKCQDAEKDVRLKEGLKRGLQMKKKSGWSRGWRFGRTLGGKVSRKSGVSSLSWVGALV